MHLEEQFELGGQLVRLLPPGGELGALLVVVMVGQLFARVGVPAEGPESVQVHLFTQRRGQREHQDPCAQTLRGKLLRLPVPADSKSGHFCLIQL